MPFSSIWAYTYFKSIKKGAAKAPRDPENNQSSNSLENL
jgi:hypothetical protein